MISMPIDNERNIKSQALSNQSACGKLKLISDPMKWNTTVSLRRIVQWIAVIALFGNGLPLLAKESPESILFIGNSFTLGAGVPAVGREMGVSGMVQKLAIASGQKTVMVKRVAKVSLDWGDHLADVSGAVTAVRSRVWDVIVLQDLSTAATNYGTHNVEAFFKDGKSFQELIRSTSPKAKIVLFQPWARKATHNIYVGNNTLFPGGPPQMQRMIGENHAKLAKEIGATVACVGDAFAKCQETWPEMNLYNPDRYHANNLGGYLGALVIFATIYQQDPRGLPALAEVPQEQAVRLQALAWSVVSGTPLDPNLRGKGATIAVGTTHVCQRRPIRKIAKTI